MVQNHEISLNDTSCSRLRKRLWKIYTTNDELLGALVKVLITVLDDYDSWSMVKNIATFQPPFAPYVFLWSCGNEYTQTQIMFLKL